MRTMSRGKPVGVLVTDQGIPNAIMNVTGMSVTPLKVLSL